MQEKLMDKNGFTYIEVIFSAAILLLLWFTALSGLKAATQNYYASENIYNAHLLSESILLETEAMLSEENVRMALFENNENEINNFKIFLTSITSNNYHTTMQINNLKTHENVFVTTEPSIVELNEVNIAFEDFSILEKYEYDNQSFDFVIYYDGMFTYENRNTYISHSVINNEITINIAENINTNVTIAVVSKWPLPPTTIVIDNKSEGDVYLNIDNESSVVQTKYLSKKGKFFSNQLRKSHTKEYYAITISVYSKDYRLIKRITKLI